MDAVCDFANSYLRWVSEGGHGNTVRINLDARCRWEDRATGQTEDFVLICRCQGERMYVEKNLIQDPAYNFWGVFSATQSHNIRTFADAATQGDTVEGHAGRFVSVDIDIETFGNAAELTTPEEIIEATLGAELLVARTEIDSPDGQVHATMEYPVTTMNVAPEHQLWQVDTGPVLFPDFERDAERRIEKLVPGFIVYNTATYAELALYTDVKLASGGTTPHYADRREVSVTNRLCVGQTL